MLNFVLFMVFSVMETYAMFYLGFKLFKIDVYPKEMIFAGVILAFFSYVIRANNQWIEVDLIIQYGLMFCFYWLLFRTHLFYAAILTGVTYQSYSFIQLVYISLLNGIGNFSFHTFYGMEISTYVMQILTSGTAIVVGYFVGRKRKGFDFIPDKPDGAITPTKREVLMFILNLPTAAIIISIMHLYKSDYFLVVPLIYGFLLFCYIYLSYKKDRSGHEYIKL